MLAIGTANPANCVLQDDFPDLYFRATDSEHLVGLKEKFKRGQKSWRAEAVPLPHRGADSRAPGGRSSSTASTRRPSMSGSTSPRPWCRSSPRRPAGRPSPSGAAPPPTSFTSSSPPTPARTSRASTSGWSDPAPGPPPLRAPHHALPQRLLRRRRRAASRQGPRRERPRRARARRLRRAHPPVLHQAHGGGLHDALITQGLFGDGAGADPVPAERPLFEIVSAAQTIIPDSEDVISMRITKGCYVGHISTRQVPELIGGSIERCLLDALEPLGIVDGGAERNGNDLFWNVHPGSAAILDQCCISSPASWRRVGVSSTSTGTCPASPSSSCSTSCAARWTRSRAGRSGVRPGLAAETMVLHRCLAQGR
ncbi:unnamed protein product [Urochloa decumbens]|uniref:Chalcone/stilbene synthase N-terminal domain-containing protein n=1 Tax=Urochloa decumbens TaxID=240449 RepID=A0ABC9ESH0_9POAL